MAASMVDKCMKTYNYVFNPSLLKGQVAFITGGGSGICFTIAEVLMRHQCSTVIASRKLERVQQAAEELSRGTGQKCLPIQMDVRKPKEVVAGVQRAMQEFGKIDILVNGAAGNFLCPASAMSFNAFKTVLDIDTIGTFNATKAVFEEYMKDNGGVIINISATLAYKATVLQTHASAAKAAIDSMTRSLAVEWGPLGIRVVGIAPGPIGDTEGMRKLAGPLTESIPQHIPLRRLGTKQDVADCAVFLSSPAASYITGDIVVVDGGSWMTSPNNINQRLAGLKSQL
ncbi:peroxisomal 2,4-dienoyl-CoA reductase [(3E)-enoyl-CoA-producing]-like [Diadema antillarum]|uniref:peroxisomal 2,4-dienoyl-CoA reductase [(3E)-enoyl-CoA-producing]-like n=1 Tax=Diadema antillarum TaxID=105358 RepID=UPI003A84E2AD